MSTTMLAGGASNTTPKSVVSSHPNAYLSKEGYPGDLGNRVS